jgi:phospholipid/cholesterol/gamma-HCH transport system substrate-binding protein
MRWARPLLVAALFVLVLPGCKQPGAGGYRLTAYFPKAVALYPHSRIKVMGIDVGTVTAIAIQGDRIRVDMSIDRKVPLPADVHAMIVPLSLIGERNVVLHPAWQPGMSKAKDHDVIPEARTEIPVEPDEALTALTNLARAIDPKQVSRLVITGAQAVKGQGENFNQSLDQVANLTSLLASQDQSLLDIAANFHQFANTLNSRQQQLVTLIQDFSVATGVLANERQAIGTFLSSLANLINQGNALITKYQQTLPGDVATLTQLVMTVRVNTNAVADLLHNFNGSSHLLIVSYNAQYHEINIRVNITPAVLTALKPTLDPILAMLGLQPIACIPLLGVLCK